MKKKYINKIAFMLLVMTAALSACSKHSETETISETTKARVEDMEDFKAAQPRKLTEQVSEGSADDIFEGVTCVDASGIWTPVTFIDFSPQSDVMIQSEDGTLTPMTEPYYTSEKIADGTWQILSDGDYSYLVEGEEIAVLIDTGYGAGNIREYCETLTDKPVKYVINTHYHFDHTANNAYFECAFMNTSSVEKATIPYPSFSGIDFPRDYPIVTVSDGYVFNLGNRELEVFEIGNHTPDGIALLDRKNKILFGGDEFMRSNTVTVNVPLETFAANMKKLEDVSADISMICGGPGIGKVANIHDYYHAAEYALSGEGEAAEVTNEAASGHGASPARGNSEKNTDTQVVYTRKRVRTPDRSTEEEPGEKIQVVDGEFTLIYYRNE